MYLDAVKRNDPPGREGLAQTWVDSVWVHQRLYNGLFRVRLATFLTIAHARAAVVQIYALPLHIGPPTLLLKRSSPAGDVGCSVPKRCVPRAAARGDARFPGCLKAVVEKTVTASCE